jgi:hypothetical protein
MISALSSYSRPWVYRDTPQSYEHAVRFASAHRSIQNTANVFGTQNEVVTTTDHGSIYTNDYASVSKPKFRTTSSGVSWDIVKLTDTALKWREKLLQTSREICGDFVRQPAILKQLPCDTSWLCFGQFLFAVIVSLCLRGSYCDSIA